MAGPIPHQQAAGIHPASFVQATEPDTAALQDGTEWTDTSAGPPYVRKVWRAGSARWDAVQMDATGYPLPDGHRLEAYTAGPFPDPTEPPLLSAVAGSSPWAAGTYYIAYCLLSQLNGGSTRPSPAAAIALDGTQDIRASLPASLVNLPLSVFGGTPTYNVAWYLVAPVPATGLAWAGILASIADNPRVLTQHMTGPSKPGPPASNTMPPLSAVRIVGPDGNTVFSHDGLTGTLLHAGMAVLQTPLPSLAATPATLVGQDPATLLPAYCPTPKAALTTYVAPVQPVPPPTGTPAGNAACGAAHAMADRLARFYELATGCIKAALNILGPVAATLIIDAALDYFTAGTAGTWMSLNGDAYAAMKIALSGVLTAVEAGLMPALDGQGKTAIINTAYHAIGPSATLPIMVTQATIDAWGVNMGADPGDFIGSQDIILQLLTHVLPLDQWQQEANTGSTNPRSGCT